MKFIKHIKRGICIMLAVIILACSPISCYMDTQRIVTVEATGLEIGGLGLLYTFAQLLGYDIGTVNAGSLRDAFISFVNKLDTIQSDTKKKIVTLVSTQVFGNDVEMGEIGSALFVVLYNFLESGTYEDIGNYNASASASAKQNYAEISFSYSASSPSGYYYNRMPSTARTAIWGQEIDSLQQHYTFFQGVDTSYYFSIYSEREDCYYMNVGGYSASDFTDGGWKEFVMFSDGLYLITFSSNGSIATYDTVDMTKYIYNSAYCTFDEVYDDTISSNSTTMQYYLYDESRGTPFQISTNFCTLKPLSVTKDVFTRSQIPKTYTGLKGLQDSSYASPCTDSLSIVKHGITDSDRIDAISNLETIPASKIASVADSYENALADVYVWSIADTYPAGDKDDTEDKIIADVYPAVDDIKESAKDNTGTKDDTNIDAGTKDDTATGDKSDADTDADTSSFWATLWGWLSKIYEMLKNLLVLSDIYLSTRSIEALISGSVVGALQNLGVYDIDIWDTTKDILGKLVSIDDLSATFNPDKLIANSDEVVYGLGDMSKTITSVREGIDGLVTELSHIGEYDIDIWNVLSSIDKILTNGAIASLGEYLGFLCEELLSSRLGIDSIADIFTDFPATIAKILSAILSLPLNLLYSLFILTPKQMVEDYIKRPADFFKPQGLIIFTGRQGRGKTVAMAEYIQHLQACYPKSKCITNFDFKYQNDELCHWKQLIDYKNAQKGVIVGMDELQNWFSSNQSRNFPPEMLSVITQNRKNRRVILGTSQNFYLLAKAIRSQATEVRECMTLAGCFTIVRCREPILDDKGDVKEWKNRGFYWFTHTPKIRNSYDTYKVIESLSESGFVERAVPQAYDEA